ncbi:hypothetical protein HPB49_018340 [Dermacentor silvarum]|uniref:Uncharacterized protein n=1 Tax=Dermacentor silvarum TaxID=543639 RepID=A0ACB8C4W6_DERSI|nr:hypothetical protein HPB49_018340 [Dermacentor silvarum]
MPAVRDCPLTPCAPRRHQLLVQPTTPMHEGGGDDDDHAMNSSMHLSPKTLFRSEAVDSSPPSSSSDLNSSTDSGVVRSLERSPSVPVQMVMPVPRQDTPPYKRIRALRLFGSPQTPKTLLQRAEAPSTVHVSRQRISQHVKPVQAPATAAALANVNPFSPLQTTPPEPRPKRPRKCYSVLRTPESATAEELWECYEDDAIQDRIVKMQRITRMEPGQSRYETEFLELTEVGSGEFGSVYKCLHRLDGCVYAIKKSRKPMRGTQDEKTALNEVYAHAVLGQHPHVVRYYSAWAENDHMIIQNEFCNGEYTLHTDHSQIKGTRVHRIHSTLINATASLLAARILDVQSRAKVYGPRAPRNIFISRVPLTALPESIDDGFDSGSEGPTEELVYKIGDLGHVTSTKNPQVEEGDCRYLSKEVLREDYSNLPKADIFALGLTVFEAGGGGPLPKNGQDWVSIRKGNLPKLEQCSQDFNQLLTEMIQKVATKRPSASSLLHHPVLVPNATKKLEEASMCLQSLPIVNSSSTAQNSRVHRLIGKKANRSHSVTNF